MAHAVPNCLLQLLRDYTSQALDAARDVSDEFEGEVEDLTRRATRIHAVLKLIRECEEKSRTLPTISTTSTSTSSSSLLLLSSSMETPLQLALGGLGEMTAELTGVVDVNSSAGSRLSGSRHYGLRPLAKPVSLAEAALELFGHNTKVVFRRTEKRGRDLKETNNTPQQSQQQLQLQSTVFASLSASQRKRRLLLYTARSAVLPLRGVAGSAAVFVPPAVREFADLNVAAECAMLAAFYCVDAKAQLLREWPALQRSVRQLQESLRSANVEMRGGWTSQQEEQEKKEEQLPWFEFPCAEAGVIRIVVRRALALEVTWDPMHGGRWRVLTLRWLLRIQTPPDLLTNPTSISHTTLEKNNTSSSSSSDNNDNKDVVVVVAGVSEPGVPLLVIPAHYEASVRYLNNYFETGLESGCLASLHLVNAVVMDVIETQCKALRETFFLGPLESSFVVDVHPGTYVAITLQPPSLVIPTTTTTTTAGSVVPLHVKYRLCMGTIVVEWRRGTDTRMTLQSDLYSQTQAENGPISAVVVVDVEQFLWKLISV